MGTIYLLHYAEPLPRTRAQHYLGYTSKNLKARLARHRRGDGANITQAFARHGIDFVVARTWHKDPWTGGNATRETESRMKDRTARSEWVWNHVFGDWEIQLRVRPSCNPKKLCPICNPGTTRPTGRRRNVRSADHSGVRAGEALAQRARQR